MILNTLTRNAQRVRVGGTDIICIPANDYDEIINQFNKMHFEKPKMVEQPKSSIIENSKDPNSLLDIRAAAKLLGISRSTMYLYLKKPNAPKAIKFNRATRYRLSEIWNFIESNQ